MAETAGGIYFPTKEDNFDLENDLPKMSESVEARLTASKGKLLIAQNTGAAVWETLKGDLTLAEDGTLTIADGAVTSRKLKPTILSKASNAEKTYSNSPEEIPGTSSTFTLPTKSILWIAMSVDLSGTWVSTDGAAFRAYMYLDGAKKNPGLTFRVQQPGEWRSQTFEETLTQTFPLEVAAGEHTLLMKGQVNNAVGNVYKTIVAEGGNSGLTGATGWNAMVLAA